jgi:hypothetical protein
MGLILALFLAGPSSSQGMGNSKSYDQNSYDWMGTPVVSGQTNAIVPDYLEAYGAQRPDWDPYGPGAVPELGRPEWDPYGAGSVSLALSLVPADPALEGLMVEGGIKLSNQLLCASRSSALEPGKGASGNALCALGKSNR